MPAPRVIGEAVNSPPCICHLPEVLTRGLTFDRYSSSFPPIRRRALFSLPFRFLSKPLCLSRSLVSLRPCYRTATADNDAPFCHNYLHYPWRRANILVYTRSIDYIQWLGYSVSVTQLKLSNDILS